MFIFTCSWKGFSFICMGSFDDLETCFGILWTVNTTCTSSKEVKKRIRNSMVQSQRWHVTYKAWDKATFIYYKEAGNQNFKFIKDWSELKRVYIVRKLFWSSLSSHSNNAFLGVVKVVDKGQCPLLTSEGTIFKAWFGTCNRLYNSSSSFIFHSILNKFSFFITVMTSNGSCSIHWY